MSNTRYIEVDSTYRNRNLWPQAGQFEVPISQTGRKGFANALDPVSKAATKTQWQSNTFVANVQGASPLLGMTVAGVVPPLGAASGNVIYTVTGTPGELQAIENYYDHAVATFAPGDVQRIIGYRYLGGDRAEVTFGSPFTGPVVAGSLLTVRDPTDVSDINNPYFFVPAGRTGSNAYANCVLFNETLSESRPVAGYENGTHLLSVDTSGSTVSTARAGPVTGWLVGHVYSVRPQAPTLCGSLGGDPASVVDTYTSFVFPPGFTNCCVTGHFLELSNRLLPADANGVLGAAGDGITTVELVGAVTTIEDAFAGCTIRMSGGPASGQEATITKYDATTKIATLSPGFDPAATPAADPYTITCPLEAYRINKYVNSSGSVVAVGADPTTTFDLSATASNTDGDYAGLYIRINGGAARLIQDYVVTRGNNGVVQSRTVTLLEPLAAPAAPGDSYEIQSGTITTPCPRPLMPTLVDQEFCILPFSYDNFNPFEYTGSLVSQQEMVCYEIELINLVLPNQTLAVGVGSRIAFYPYVYVELSNVSAASAGNKNIIYSNNPNSTRMTFRAAIDDVPNPVFSSFVKIDGDGMVQTIKFKPNDNLRFSVTLPNGEVFQTVLPEFFSPHEPNPLTQISAAFAIRRL